MTSLQVFEALQPLQDEIAAQRAQGRLIGFVPTMGNLHAGHLALVEEARRHCGFVVASIFVNPMQFGPGEDLARYPRTFEADKSSLDSVRCDALFFPSAALMYPDGPEAHTRISVPHISTLYCGHSRPGHFDGVCTVVCKLFNMIRPDHAFFGLKDYQQFFILSRMVEDLRIPVRMHGLPTVRESSGLAMSSRNGYLSAEERLHATALYATLRELAALIRQSAMPFRELEERGANLLRDAGLRPDYVRICRRDTLLEARAGDHDLIILAAAYAGSTRLIDNISV